MPTPSLVHGRVWKFGDDVDTDVMAPWGSLLRPWEERRRDVLAIRPGFVDQVRPGDLVVAGRNWGCGSSREQAPENLRLLGLAAVVAESFSRIYFRNALALAFPHVVCPGVHAACEEGDELEVDLGTGQVRNLTRGRTLAGRPYTADMLAILEQGGLLNVLARRLGVGPLGDRRPGKD